MKKIIRIVLILLLTCFSFYYTDKIISLAKMRDPLMKEIISYQNSYNYSYENGVLTKDTLLVGSVGKKININKSYEKMKKINSFNKTLLEYEEVIPSINKKNNLDKLIKGKKTNNYDISFVFYINNLENLEQIIYILDQNNIKANFFIDAKLIEDNIDNISKYFKNNHSLGYYSYNNNDDNISLKYVKAFTKTNKLNISNYCLYKNKIFLDSCISNKINTIKPTVIKSNLYNYIKSNKQKGYIYQIEDNSYNIRQLNSTIGYLKNKGYNFLLLNDLLKE